jgi:hypothetical protein
MSHAVFFEFSDPNAVPRRHKINIIVSIQARYVLTSKIDAKGNRREFSCRVVKLSPYELVVAAPVKGAIGERVIATLLEFGKIEGKILKTQSLGFVMSVNMTDEERERFAAKIEWHDKHKNFDLPDNRKSRRIVPENPHSVIILGDGTVVGAFVIDVSVSGAAVSADVDVNIGDPLAVGRIVGRVVRHFPGGFAVKFIEPQDPRALEISLRVPGPTRD